jgi:outer membrane receptor protein involved in Fe transport
VPVSPRAALIYDGLDERLTLKGIFSMAFVAPPPYYENNVFFNGVQISSPNPSLQPEQSVSGELNATWQDKNLLASLSGYYNHQSNLLITAQSENPETVASPRAACDGVPLANRAMDPACRVWADVGGGAATAAPAILRHSINLGSSDAKGFDLFGRYGIGPVTSGGMSFATWASYSFVDFSQTLGALTTGLPQISRHNVRLGVTWTILKNLSITPSLVLRSTPENLADPTYANANLSLNTPYQVNANALYTPLEWLDVFLTGRNLTNNHYALRGVSGPQPQEPVTAMLGARIRY